VRRRCVEAAAKGTRCWCGPCSASVAARPTDRRPIWVARIGELSPSVTNDVSGVSRVVFDGCGRRLARPGIPRPSLDGRNPPFPHLSPNQRRQNRNRVEVAARWPVAFAAQRTLKSRCGSNFGTRAYLADKRTKVPGTPCALAVRRPRPGGPRGLGPTSARLHTRGRPRRAVRWRCGSPSARGGAASRPGTWRSHHLRCWGWCTGSPR
jgi:hypothetical protein